MRTPFFILAALLLIAVLAGCSGKDPVAPGSRGEGAINQQAIPDADTNGSNPAFAGFYNINIDTKEMTGTVEPIRSVGSVDVFEAVDVTGFLTIAPCTNCVRIFRLGFNEENQLVMSLGIKHPFPQGDPSKEITGRNRADLHLFNIEGILVTDQPGIINFPSKNMSISTGFLVNPDGYTGYLDQMLDLLIPTTSQAHPYILHFDDYSQGNFSGSNPFGFADVLNPTGNLVMKMGSDYSIKDYIFDIPAGQTMNFAFAVGATFGMAAGTFTDRFIPVFRCPQYNKKAASEVHVGIVENNLERGDTSSYAKLRIEVMDINQNTAVGDEKDKMPFESKVSYISLLAPELGNEIVLNNPTPISGDGRNTPLVFEANVINQLNAPIGNTPCLIQIKDSYPVRSNPNPALGKADIMGRTTPRDMVLSYTLEFTTYQYIELSVGDCQGVSLRTGPTPVDIAVDGQGNSYIAYNDNQVWKYDYDFCTATHLYDVDFTFAGTLMRIDAHQDGRTIMLSDGCST